jgi:hypothetical protein
MAHNAMTHQRNVSQRNEASQYASQDHIRADPSYTPKHRLLPAKATAEQAYVLRSAAFSLTATNPECHSCEDGRCGVPVSRVLQQHNNIITFDTAHNTDLGQLIPQQFTYKTLVFFIEETGWPPGSFNTNSKRCNYARI